MPQTPTPPPSGPPAPAPSTGDIIGTDITVAAGVINPVVSALDPAIAPGVALALGVLAQVEPAIYNIVAAIFQGTPLTAAQLATIAAIEPSLADPDSYLRA